VEFIKSETNKRSTGSSSVFELKIITNDGTMKDILVTATPSFSMNKFQGTFAIFRDITERKKTELEIKLKNEELQKLIATKDKFFSIIAHDLKSPFNAIVGFSELLVEKVKDNDYDGIAKFAGIILESSERAMALLLNLMDWSLSQTGRMEFIPEYFEYIEFINNLTLPYQDIAGQKSITITKELPHTMPVFADKAMISTVLRNLMSNAIKFTRPGGEIMISVEEKPGELITAIKDNGVGISPTTVARLFRIDENVTTIGTNKEKGTGLGLILCKEFVENHGGKIWVDSQEGKGSKFTFTIPTSK
jgi:signal transduction histidine kinase